MTKPKDYLNADEKKLMIQFAAIIDTAKEIESMPSLMTRNSEVSRNVRLCITSGNKALKAILEGLTDDSVDALYQAKDRHIVYIAGRKHNPVNNEIPVVKDDIVDVGLAMLEVCSLCNDETQLEHEQCRIYRFFTKYFDLDRGGNLCPYAELKDGK